MLLLKILIVVVLIYIALCIACAVWHAVRRAPGIGVHGFQHPRHVDPYSSAFGDVPYTGFTSRQLGDVAPKRTYLDPLNRSIGSRGELVYGAGMRSRHVDLSSAGALRRNAAGGRSVPSWTSAGRTGGFQ